MPRSQKIEQLDSVMPPTVKSPCLTARAGPLGFFSPTRSRGKSNTRRFPQNPIFQRSDQALQRAALALQMQRLGEASGLLRGF